MVQSTMKVYGGNKANIYNADPEVQLAIAQANSMEDSAMVDKQITKIDTDRENDEAIAKSLEFIRTDKENMDQVVKESRER